MGQGNTGQTTTNRPSVLQNVTTSQMEELDEHYNHGKGERSAWDALIKSYGWSEQDGKAVWQWFTDKPEEGHDPFSTGSGQK